VKRFFVNLGDAVRAGQPLVSLDSFDVAQAQLTAGQAEAAVQQARAGIQTARAEVSQAEAGVRQARAEADQARTRLGSATTTLQRQIDLAKAGAFSQAPLQAAKSEVAAAEAERDQAQAELATHTTQLRRTERLFKDELVSRGELEAAQLEQQQNQTTLTRALARVAIAKQALQRELTVFDSGLLNAREVQTAEAEVRIAQGDVQKAKQGILRAQQDFRRAQKGEQAGGTVLSGAESAMRASRANLYALAGTNHASGGAITISAPISGVITERMATVGEAVERTAALLVIENLSSVSVEAAVPESQVARIRIGQAVTVTAAAYPNLRFPGSVQSIAGRVDEKTRALPVRCLVENPKGLLRPEMFAKVTLGVGTRSHALAVPESAIDEDGDARYIYVKRGDKYERRKVKLGRLIDSAAEIVSGLAPGDLVVIEGVFVLKSEANKDKLKGDD